MSSAGLKPFADDSASVGLGGLTIENGADRIAVYGNLDLTRDKAGLALAQQLLTFAQSVVAALQAGPLPAAMPPPAKPGSVKNPFG